MKAIVRCIDKKYLPDSAGLHRLHVVTDVDFLDDSGELVLSQTYGHLPDDFDGAYFQRQADAMQGDIECLKERAKAQAALENENKPVDDAIRKFKLEFGEAIQLRDEVQQ